MTTVDVWDAVADRTDTARVRPRVAPDVEIRDFALRWGNDYAMAKNPRDRVYYRLTPSEAQLARSMDGTRTINDLVVTNLDATGEFDADTVTDLVNSLREGGFLDGEYVDTYALIERRLRDVPAWRERLETFLRTLEIDWPNADGFVRSLYRVLRVAFTLPALIIGALVAVLGLAAFVDLVRPGRYHLVPAKPGREFAVILILDLVIIGVHELGHALVLVRHGKRVNSAGFRIYFGAPSFYVEASEALMMDRGPRIVQAFAGPYAELILAAPAALYVWLSPHGFMASTLYKWAVLNYFVVFMNLMPMLELDGYWILSDAIQVPDLRPRSLAFVRHDLWRKLRKRERWNWSEVGLLAFGTFGVAFTLFALWISYFFWKRIFVPVILAMWHGGAGGRILLALLALLVGGPILRAVSAGVRAFGSRARDAWRRARFAGQKRWRIEAAELLDDLPLFDDLPVEVLNDVAGRVRLRTVALGEPVVVQGERGGGYFVVRSGSFAVEETDPITARMRTLKTLGRGEAFGELGIAEHASRTATVRATTRAEVFELDSGTFERLLKERLIGAAYGPSLARLGELRALSCFRHLGPAELGALLEHGEWTQIEAGRTIVRQGEPSDAFFAIESGRLEVIEDERHVRELGAGSYFGEIGLLSYSPRTATVRAITPVRAFRMDREGFDALVGRAFRSGALVPHAVSGLALEH